MASKLTGRFSNARNKPFLNLSSLNGSRVASDLITRGITNLAVSNVVKRSLHSVHSRRRRIDAPPLTSHQSITLVSGIAQEGLFKGESLALGHIRTLEIAYTVL